MKIGVLALQGAFQEHLLLLERLGISVKEVRLPEDLSYCNGLILPGGETTAQRRLALTYGLWRPIQQMAKVGIPILGTCAGMILMARRIDEREGISLDLMDFDVQRNAYGRQIYSFEASISVSIFEQELGEPLLFQAIFIRAPRIVHVGRSVTLLATCHEEPVALQQGNLLALSFHPELTSDDRFHRYFISLVEKTLTYWSPQELPV
jgi:5'-phosphate synthase pdxT subunit